MKTLLLAIPVLLLPALGYAQAESARTAYNQVEQICRDWDPVRGPWLAGSLESMSSRLEVPDRTFPERFTPNQMLRMMPAQSRNEILTIATNERNNGNDVNFWSDVQRYVRNAGCGTASARTYGDPHLVSFDGARNSFQTVGEFTLTESASGDMVVQARQKAQSEDFSLNTALAMNVAGDRVCIYTHDFPDGDYSTPLRLDGRPLHLNGSTYTLAYGGTIKKVGKDYTVYWPTGESVTAEIRRSGSFEFMNVTVQVNECSSETYSGVLGTPNGSSRDDYANAGVSPVVWGSNDDYANRKRQEYMAKEFAELHRITQATSLFDYIIGTNTLTYTDRSFPRVYRDLSDLNSRQLGRAQRYCQSQNIDQRDMNACVYDNAYLGIDASPAPTVPDPVQGTVLRPVEVQEPVSRPTGGDTPRPVTDKETDRDTPVSSPGRTTEEPTSNSVEADKPVSRPAPTPAPKPEPVQRPEPRPEPRPAPLPTPKPAPPAPRPAPVLKPVPAPKPSTPSPAPKIGGRG